jgi:hypothetical protein
MASVTISYDEFCSFYHSFHFYFSILTLFISQTPQAQHI